MKARLSKPNRAEYDWISENVATVQSLVTQLDDARNEIDPAALDLAYGSWIEHHDRESDDPNPMINAFGLALGQALVDELGLSWVVASDGQGAEIAIHGQPGNVLVYPTNLVAKRYAGEEREFFEPLFRAMCREIQSVRSQPAAEPWWKFWRRG